MTTEKVISIAIIMALLGTVVYLGGANLNSDNAYYCKERNAVANCDKLSRTGLTCYSGSTYFKCTSVWLKIEKEVTITTPVQSGGISYTCDQDKCTPMEG